MFYQWIFYLYCFIVPSQSCSWWYNIILLCCQSINEFAVGSGKFAVGSDTLLLIRGVLHNNKSNETLLTD